MIAQECWHFDIEPVRPDRGRHTMPARAAAISAASPGFEPPAVAFATEAIARAHRINDSASMAVSKARELVRKSAALRLERGCWRHLWAVLRTEHDRVIAICAYCQRVRTQQGDWGAIPARMRVFLSVTSVLIVTHGICPECVEEHFPMVSLP
jgi:hypothetical protein